jgi:hypothetical protein
MLETGLDARRDSTVNDTHSPHADEMSTKAMVRLSLQVIAVDI